MLSASVAIRTLVDHRFLANPELVFYSDNSSLVARMLLRTTYLRSFPNDTLTPDYDLTETIFQQHSGLTASYRWVRGHQDKTVPLKSLPVEARYNVMADELADEPVTNPNITPVMFPATSAALLLSNTLVTSRYINTVLYVSASIEYRDHFLAHKIFSMDQMALIDWAALQKAHKRSPHPSIQKNKLIHQLLPTRAHCRRFKPGTTGECPRCHCLETFDHLMQCPAPSSIDFRSKVANRLAAFFHEWHIPATIAQNLSTGSANSLTVNRPPRFLTPPQGFKQQCSFKPNWDGRPSCAALHQPAGNSRSNFSLVAKRSGRPLASCHIS